jgi:hypothetical protein
MRPENPIAVVAKPDSGHYPEPDESIPLSPHLPFRFIFISSPHLLVGLPSNLFPSVFTTIMGYTLLTSLTLTKYPYDLFGLFWKLHSIQISNLVFEIFLNLLFYCDTELLWPQCNHLTHRTNISAQAIQKVAGGSTIFCSGSLHKLNHLCLLFFVILILISAHFYSCREL